ncbi:hypothetical protein LIER_35065 [Lithospermum erythrorhizon]|uniref:Uncharacterized protein n=1 Tax=Lithospermum erythrorhizon TaxID=34254 RepID=A0AAV3NK51_LITER
MSRDTISTPQPFSPRQLIRLMSNIFSDTSLSEQTITAPFHIHLFLPTEKETRLASENNLMIIVVYFLGLGSFKGRASFTMILDGS